eukprot:m51a1_g6098 hypothetical protein (142) ;mRNA; f:60493-67074
MDKEVVVKVFAPSDAETGEKAKEDIRKEMNFDRYDYPYLVAVLGTIVEPTSVNIVILNAAAAYDAAMAASRAALQSRYEAGAAAGAARLLEQQQHKAQQKPRPAPSAGDDVRQILRDVGDGARYSPPHKRRFGGDRCSARG